MQLINGVYSKDDALDLVQQMFNVKLRFHETKISTSDSEEDIKMRERRIKELQKDLAGFRETLGKHQGPVTMHAPLEVNHNLETAGLSLINGRFAVEDALEILQNAYKAKIDFHRHKAFSKTERGENGAQQHVQRAGELEAELQRAKELLHLNQGQKVNITCSVSLQFMSERDEVNVREPEVVYSH